VNQRISTIIQQNQQNHTRKSTQARWYPPPEKYYKINTDANLEVDGFWGLSAIPRDTHGAVVAAETWRERGDQIAVEAEVKALMNATNLAIDCCFLKVILESDCERIVKGTNDPYQMGFPGSKN